MQKEKKPKSLSPTMEQAAKAAELEELDPPCYGDKNCDCGRRFCPSNPE